MTSNRNDKFLKIDVLFIFFFTHPEDATKKQKTKFIKIMLNTPIYILKYGSADDRTTANNACQFDWFKYS